MGFDKKKKGCFFLTIVDNPLVKRVNYQQGSMKERILMTHWNAKFANSIKLLEKKRF